MSDKRIIYINEQLTNPVRYKKKVKSVKYKPIKITLLAIAVIGGMSILPHIIGRAMDIEALIHKNRVPSILIEEQNNKMNVEELYMVDNLVYLTNVINEDYQALDEILKKNPTKTANEDVGISVHDEFKLFEMTYNAMNYNDVEEKYRLNASLFLYGLRDRILTTKIDNLSSHLFNIGKKESSYQNVYNKLQTIINEQEINKLEYELVRKEHLNRQMTGQGRGK